VGERGSGAATSGVVSLAEVAAERVRWLWPGRVPLGKLTVLEGDPGLGKSAVALDLAARATRGAAMPDGSRADLSGPVGVVLLCAEDGLGDTVRPRLEAAGADLGRVVAVTGVEGRRGPRPVRLPMDLAELLEAVRQARGRLIVIDPLMAFLDPTVNVYGDVEMRTVLAPLAMLAARLQQAMVLVRHLTKTTVANPLYRGGGSIGIIGVARSGLLVARDPRDASGARRVLATVKGNLTAAAPALAFRLEPVGGAGVARAVRVVWDGAVAETAESLVAASLRRRDVAEGEAQAEAVAFLRAALADGPQPAAGVLEAARAAGLAERTLRRAKATLGVGARKDGARGGWWWDLPPRPPSL